MEWISCKQELPDKEQEVFYYFDMLGVFAGKYKKVEDDMDCFYGESGDLCDDVTHWMPRKEGDKLPAPPEL